MKIIKRNGAEAVFDIQKIVNAVTKANEAVDEKVRMTPLQPTKNGIFCVCKKEKLYFVFCA